MNTQSDAEAVLGALLRVADTKGAHDQIVAAFETLVKSYGHMLQDTKDERAQRDREFAAMRKEVQAQFQSALSQIEDGEDGKDYVLTPADKNEIAGLIKVPVVEKETIIKEQPIVKEVALYDTAEDIRNKLELLRPGEKLAMDAVENLLETIKRLELELAKKLKGTGTMLVPVGAGGGSKTVTYYDLSTQLNGVLTSFSLPAFFKMIDVKLSSLPVLRKDTDYSIDPSAFTLTFLSPVAAATDLSAGQSLIVIYAE